jgi:hypothetical protein
MRAMSSFGRIRHKIRRFGGNSKAATPCARITPVVALEGVLYFPSGRCGAASNVLGATPVQPRRVRESRPLWCRIRAAPLSGGSVTNPVCWRQLRYDPLVCGNHACRGAWMDTALSREGGANPETLEFAPVLPRMRESNDCACRGLDVCCNFFGGCRMTPKHRTHLRAATPRAKSAIATSVCGLHLSREVRCGNCVERRSNGPRLSREVRHQDRADSRLRQLSPSGGR